MESSRVVASFKAINQYSLALLTLFYIMVYRGDCDSWLYCILAPVAVLLFSISGTRTILVVILPLLVVYVWLQRASFPATGVACVLVGLFLLAHPMSLHVDETIRVTGESMQEATTWWEKIQKINPSRYHQMVTFFEVYPEEPLLGVGLGNFKYAMADRGHPSSWIMHNTFASILVETGALGLVAFLLFIFTVFYQGMVWEWDVSIQHLIVLGIMAHFGFSMWQYGLRTRHFWVMIGIYKAIGGNNAVQRV
jgi:O-antigen ligase